MPRIEQCNDASQLWTWRTFSRLKFAGYEVFCCAAHEREKDLDLILILLWLRKTAILNIAEAQGDNGSFDRPFCIAPAEIGAIWGKKPLELKENISTHNS